MVANIIIKSYAKEREREIISNMEILRESVDALEGLLPENMWPLPSYAKMMSLV